MEGEREKGRERWDWWKREGQPIGTSDDFPGDGWGGWSVPDRGSRAEEKSGHEQPVALQCQDICLYSTVSRCATRCDPPPQLSGRDTLPRDFLRNIMLAARIRYHRDLSVWQDAVFLSSFALAPPQLSRPQGNIMCPRYWDELECVKSLIGRVAIIQICRFR